MPETYYTDSVNYPYVLFAVMNSLQYHVCSLLYPDEDYSESAQRYILSDLEAGDEIAIKDAIESFGQSQENMPFTCYNFSDEVMNDDRQTHYEKSKKFYSSIVNSYVQTLPVELDIPMVSFFSNPSDYWRARTILYSRQGKLDRLYVPLIVNGILCSVTADLTWEISKGNFAHQFEQFLQQGDIYNISHTVNILYRHIVIDAEVALVDDIEVSLRKIIDANTSILINEFVIPPIPEIISTDPVDNAILIGIGKNIVIDFNVSMNEDSFLDGLIISPWVNADFEWNDISDQVIINPVENLLFDTEYLISLSTNLISTDNIPLENDYEFSFTTVIN